MITFDFINNSDIYSIIPLLKLLKNDVSEHTLKDRLDEMVKQNYQCIGIFDEEELIGVCGIWILTKYYIGKHIELDNVVLLPRYQNKGIGKELMSYIDDYARKIDCVANELNCYVNNEKARKFWEKEGYEIIAYHFQKKFS